MRKAVVNIFSPSWIEVHRFNICTCNIKWKMFNTFFNLSLYIKNNMNVIKKIMLISVYFQYNYSFLKFMVNCHCVVKSYKTASLNIFSFHFLHSFVY